MAIQNDRRMRKISKAFVIFVLGWAVGWLTYQYWPKDEPSREPETDLINPDSVAGIAPHHRTREALLPETDPLADITTLLTNHKFHKAIELYEDAQTHQDRSVIQQFRGAILAHVESLDKDGHYREASRLLELFLELEYRDTEAMELLARIYFAQNDFHTAIQMWYNAKAHAHRQEDLSRITKRIRATVSKYADVLKARGDKHTLMELYQWLSNLEPDYAAYFINLAEAQLEIHDHEAARQSLMLVTYDPVVGNQAQQLLRKIDGTYSTGVPVSSAIPLTSVGDHFLVDAWLNDQVRVTLLIDTGASLTVIKPNVLNNAGVHYSDTRRVGRFTTANGVIHAPILALEKISLGDHQIEQIQIGAIELNTMPGVDGLLGMNYLKHFRFFIDQTENVLRISPIDSIGQKN